MSRFSKYAWFLVLYNMFVIVWGTIVRATGSGAGCGNHWPQCQGEILPTLERLETVIEFVHRLTSGLDGILVIVLLIWAFRLQPVQKFVRQMAVMSLIFVIIEGILGAALVRFELVEDNTSTARAIMIGLHLVNTLVLLGFLTLTAWGASRPKAKESLHLTASSKLIASFSVAIVLFWIMSAAGAITALGDTLFPAASLAAGIQQDLSPTAHFLIRLRVWHPVIAIVTSTYLFALGWFIQRRTISEHLEPRFNLLFLLIAVQIGAGILNVTLLAPLWLQIAHLLLADSLWILLVIITAETLTMQAESAPQISLATGD
ncbi:MAG: COX15/CtaA family protein [Anaerolineae bacterium]|nr:COX15/CtaA family protein [Anaerolineae bacterium]